MTEENKPAYKLIGKEETNKQTNILEEDIEEIARLIIEKSREENRRLSVSEIVNLVVEEQKKRYFVKTILWRTPETSRIIGTFYYNNGHYIEGERDLISQFRDIIRVAGLDKDYGSYANLRNNYEKMLKDQTKSDAEFEEKLVLCGDILLNWEGYFYTDDAFIFPASPEHLCVHRIPHRIDHEILIKHKNNLDYQSILEEFRSKCTYSKYLEDWTGERYPLLLEWIGFPLLTGSYPLKAFLVIYGDGNNGKSVFFESLKELYGEENIASQGFHALASEQNRFSRVELYHKMANIYDDMPRTVIGDIGYIKMLTGESTINGERKFRDPIYFKNYAKMMFSCNIFPEVRRADDAFWDRAIVLPFPNVFEKNEAKKRAILEVTRQEAPKILAYGLLAIRNAVLEGKFSFRGTPKDASRIWQRRSNSVIHFIETGKEEGWITIEDGVREETNKVYDAYVAFCKDQGLDIKRKEDFTKELERNYKIHSVPEKGKRYYQGVKLRKENLEENMRLAVGM
jgi:putative DNA primase/helicase